MKLYYVLKPLLREENTRALRVYRVKDNDLSILIDTYLYKGVEDEDVKSFTTKETQRFILETLELQPDAVEFVVL